VKYRFPFGNITPAVPWNTHHYPPLALLLLYFIQYPFVFHRHPVMYYPYQKRLIQRFGFGKQLIELKSAISPSRSQTVITRIPSGIFTTLLSIILSHRKLSFPSIGRFFLLL
jgi:hypothetical protein